MRHDQHYCLVVTDTKREKAKKKNSPIRWDTSMSMGSSTIIVGLGLGATASFVGERISFRWPTLFLLLLFKQVIVNQNDHLCILFKGFLSVCYESYGILNFFVESIVQATDHGTVNELGLLSELLKLCQLCQG
jgi:hypothetical protein